jgi:hypothetical protein
MKKKNTKVKVKTEKLPVQTNTICMNMLPNFNKRFFVQKAMLAGYGEVKQLCCQIKNNTYHISYLIGVADNDIDTLVEEFNTNHIEGGRKFSFEQ